MGNKQGQSHSAKLEGPADALGCGQLVNGHHGDPARGHRFWVYPRKKRIVTPRWDTHEAAAAFCSNSRLVKRHADGLQEFECLGHCEVAMPPAHSPGCGQLVGSYHGDPARAHHFWVYPKHKRVVTPRWDTQEEPRVFCSNCRFVRLHSDNLQEYRCLGHFQAEHLEMPQDFQPPSSNERMLMELGFNSAAAKRALRESNGDVNAAAAMLLEGAVRGSSDRMASNATDAAAASSPADSSLASAASTNSSSAHSYPQPGPRNRQLPASRRSSLDIEQFWACDPQGGGPSEFLAAQQQICVSPSLMCSSGLQRTLSALDAQMLRCPLQGAFADTATDAIAVAFALESTSEARRYTLSIRDVASGPALASACRTHGLLSPWQQAYLQAAVREVAAPVREGGDPTQLQLVLGYLVRAAEECAARRQWAFVQAVGAAGEVIGAEEAGREQDERREEGEEAGGEERAARELLREAAHKFIDERKTQAFQTAFVEPTLAYARSVRDHVMEGDVDVHGANVHLALLLACLGVRLPRQPLLRDEVKAVVNFLDAGLTVTTARGVRSPLLPALWHPDNLGRAAGSLRSKVHGPPPVHSSCTPGLPVRRHEFFFAGATPLEVAKAAVAGGGGVDGGRRRRALGVCLEQFASYFTEEAVVERMVLALMADDILCSAADTVCKGMAARGEVGQETLRELVWSETEEGDYVFCRSSAAQLLVAIGALKPA